MANLFNVLVIASCIGAHGLGVKSAAALGAHKLSARPLLAGQGNMSAKLPRSTGLLEKTTVELNIGHVLLAGTIIPHLLKPDLWARFPHVTDHLMSCVQTPGNCPYFDAALADPGSGKTLDLKIFTIEWPFLNHPDGHAGPLILPSPPTGSLLSTSPVALPAIDGSISDWAVRYAPFQTTGTPAQVIIGTHNTKTLESLVAAAHNTDSQPLIGNYIHDELKYADKTNFPLLFRGKPSALPSTARIQGQCDMYRGVMQGLGVTQMTVLLPYGNMGDAAKDTWDSYTQHCDSGTWFTIVRFSLFLEPWTNIAEATTMASELAALDNSNKALIYNPSDTYVQAVNFVLKQMQVLPQAGKFIWTNFGCTSSLPNMGESHVSDTLQNSICRKAASQFGAEYYDFKAALDALTDDDYSAGIKEHVSGTVKSKEYDVDAKNCWETLVTVLYAAAAVVRDGEALTGSRIYAKIPSITFKGLSAANVTYNSDGDRESSDVPYTIYFNQIGAVATPLHDAQILQSTDGTGACTNGAAAAAGADFCFTR